MTTYQYAHRRHQGVDSRTRPTESGSPSSPVTIRQLTEEERAELDERLSGKKKPHKISKEGYLSERAKGKTRAQIADEHDITAAGLAGAINRWGLSDKGDEQRAIREHMGVVLPPGVRVFRPGDPAPSPPLAVQEPARDEIENEEGDCMAEVAKTQETGAQESAHEVTQAEREEMFGVDGRHYPPAVLMRDPLDAEWERGTKSAAAFGVTENASDMRTVDISFEVQIRSEVDVSALSGVSTARSAADAMAMFRLADQAYKEALVQAYLGIRDWTGDCTQTQLQAWVQRALSQS